MNNEEEVIKVFIFKIGKTVIEIGISFYFFGIFGVFFDGFVDDEIVFETKCLYIERNFIIEEAVKLVIFCFEKNEGGEGYVLKKDYVYWY